MSKRTYQMKCEDDEGQHFPLGDPGSCFLANLHDDCLICLLREIRPKLCGANVCAVETG